MKRSIHSAALAALLSTSVLPTLVLADTFDFGDSSEKFKGVGDREPPRCQFNVPRSATAPFFITWNCVDDAASDDEIVSELWILRKDAIAPRKLADFLGFPAAVQIDETILQSPTIAEGLPASFRLIARDRAGIATISKYYPVLSQDNAVGTCDLRLQTESTSAEGGTTGVPSLVVSVSNAAVRSEQATAQTVQITTTSATLAEPCEIDTICEPEEGQLTFAGTLRFDDETTGTLTISPGSVVVQLTGTSQSTSGSLQSFEVQGTTTIDELSTEVTLSCRP